MVMVNLAYLKFYMFGKILNSWKTKRSSWTSILRHCAWVQLKSMITIAVIRHKDETQTILYIWCCNVARRLLCLNSIHLGKIYMFHAWCKIRFGLFFCIDKRRSVRGQFDPTEEYFMEGWTSFFPLTCDFFWENSNILIPGFKDWLNILKEIDCVQRPEQASASKPVVKSHWIILSSMIVRFIVSPYCSPLRRNLKQVLS